VRAEGGGRVRGEGGGWVRGEGGGWVRAEGGGPIHAWGDGGRSALGDAGLDVHAGAVTDGLPSPRGSGERVRVRGDRGVVQDIGDNEGTRHRLHVYPLAMPWKECRSMDLRRELVLAAGAPGANISQLCQDFGISRTNAYKWLRRYRQQGEAGLEDRSRRPLSVSGTDGETVLRLIELRRRYPRWGAKKMRVLLLAAPERGDVPSVKTIARILDRAGEPRIRRLRRRVRIVLREHDKLELKAPNDVWTVDFKGWWRTRDRKRFEPLTVRDAFSRYVLCLQMLGSTSAEVVKPAFEKLFEANGLPRVIRVDNGTPFACTTAPAGLSRLSAWWTSLGIRVSFSRPAHPQDNGSHERMHADVAAELEADPETSAQSQQLAADRWRQQFNEVRPHEAIGMKTPAAIYVRSSRRFRGVRVPVYPVSYAVRRVTQQGCVRYAGRTIFISESVGGFDVAVRRTKLGRLAVRFYELDLGSFDLAAAPHHRRPRLIAPQHIPTRKRASA
jgi:putative transposase